MWFLCRRASVRAFVMQRPLLGPQKTGARTALRRIQPHCAMPPFCLWLSLWKAPTCCSLSASDVEVTQARSLPPCCDACTGTRTQHRHHAEHGLGLLFHSLRAFQLNVIKRNQTAENSSHTRANHRSSGASTTRKRGSTPAFRCSRNGVFRGC